MLTSEDQNEAPGLGAGTLSKRKKEFREFFDDFAPLSDQWKERHDYYYASDLKYLRFLIPEGARLLILGCGTGRVLEALKPSVGVGVDFSERMIARAQSKHPDLEFIVADVENLGALAARFQTPFDYVLVSDTLGYLDDIQAFFEQIHQVTDENSRIVIAQPSHLWEPLFRLAERLGIKKIQPSINYVGAVDIENILELTNFQRVKRQWRTFIPYRWLGLGPLINNTIATLPFLQAFGLRLYVVARPDGRQSQRAPLSASVLIPCRNEFGNIENAVKRLPRFCDDMEILFVEGNSSDNTFEECERVQEAYRLSHNIRVVKQQGKGKGDAVRQGFSEATKDVLFILDADLTTPPEDMPKFYDAINSGKAEFVNGSRLVYPLEKNAMRFLNYLANRTFAFIFSYLLDTRLTDTLCGTKVLRRQDYIKLEKGRSYFGDFDPFGDFDLIFGAAKLNLKIIEVPVRYRAREYGRTQISRFRDGWELLKMVVFAFRKMKIH